MRICSLKSLKLGSLQASTGAAALGSWHAYIRTHAHTITHHTCACHLQRQQLPDGNGRSHAHCCAGGPPRAAPVCVRCAGVAWPPLLCRPRHTAHPRSHLPPTAWGLVANRHVSASCALWGIAGLLRCLQASFCLHSGKPTCS